MNRVGFLDVGCEPREWEVELEPSDRKGRLMYRRLLELDMERVGWSGGTKTPSWRKDLTLDMRMSEDADGERRMIGSWFLDGFRG